MAELLTSSQDVAEELLLATEEKLIDTENHLRSVRTNQRKKEKEWENQKIINDDKEIDLVIRERRVKEETNALAALHKSMSIELSGSMKGESMAYYLLKQREN